MPMPERVAQGVYRVDAVGLRNTISVLLIESNDGWTLVDAGVSNSAPRILEALSALGSGPGDLKRVFLTHHHMDHIGGLPGLLEKTPEAEVAGTEHEAEIVSGRREKDLPSSRLLRPLMRHLKLPTAPVGHVLREGDLVTGFRIIATPGHTLGHASLLRDEDGLLFTGDAFGVLFRRIRVGGVKALSTDPPLAKRSAEKILTEDFGAVVMTHGRPLYSGGRERLREAVERR